MALNHRLHKVLAWLCVLSALGACDSRPPAVDGTESVSRPNILFIMSDDHTSQAIGAYGGRLAGLNPTPTIDALAAEGTRFDNVFATNSICTPSRASIITGQYSQTNGVLDLEGKIGEEQQHLPRLPPATRSSLRPSSLQLHE